MPEPLVGSVLLPLNELESLDRAAWLRQRSKYDGREEVMSLRVPLLDCLWNDVLHLSPVHPRAIVEALDAAGFSDDRRRFFEIDARQLDPGRTVVFLNSTDREHRFDPSQWSWFEPDTVPALATVPELTRAYFAECASRGWTPLRFAHVPHVLYRGSLDVSGVPVVEV